MRAGRDGPVLAASEQLLLSIDKNAGAQGGALAHGDPGRARRARQSPPGLDVPKLAGSGVALKRG